MADNWTDLGYDLQTAPFEVEGFFFFFWPLSGYTEEAHSFVRKSVGHIQWIGLPCGRLTWSGLPLQFAAMGPSWPKFSCGSLLEG